MNTFLHCTNKRTSLLSGLFFLYFLSLLAQSKIPGPVDGTDLVKMDYQLHFDEAEKHYVGVELFCKELPKGTINLKMPVWAPGYYKILDSPQHVSDFKAFDVEGNELPWKKTSKNRWSIDHGNNSQMRVVYKVFANRTSVAESNVDSQRAFLASNSIFMHVEGQVAAPVTVAIDLPVRWTNIATGLTKHHNGPHTFFASNFDVLYDSPFYIGNHKTFDFDFEGRSYGLAIANADGLMEDVFVGDLKKIIGATTDLMGHVPYQYYSFIMMEAGGGGLEHWNSQVIFTKGSFNFKDGEAYTDFLNFVTHEYFHLYNVKAIRPIAFGPFDYDRENYTNMLWVSEGLTVYYEYIIMIRAGLMEGQKALDHLGRSIRSYENIEGKRHMSLQRSSYDIWLNFLSANENYKDVAISYYDKGPIIGFLLDLKIRFETDNKKSLDDVMRYLYTEIYQKENRGFTDAEFWDACERVAGGTSLDEIKGYVTSTVEIDYQKYLDHAGLQIDLDPLGKGNSDDGLVKRKYALSKKDTVNKLQKDIRKSLFKL